jgi:hypothetical protein
MDRGKTSAHVPAMNFADVTAEPGDVVQLRSSDRHMTFDRVNGSNVDCAWREGKREIIGGFYIDSLLKISVQSGPLGHTGLTPPQKKLQRFCRYMFRDSLELS